MKEWYLEKKKKRVRENKILKSNWNQLFPPAVVQGLLASFAAEFLR